MTYEEALAIQDQVRKHDPFVRLPVDLIILSEQAEIVLKKESNKQEISKVEEALF